jgi:uncharacterized protein YjbJ (UPF0337 family)
MSEFRQYIENTLFAESVISNTAEGELLELSEAVDLMEQELNELLGLGKLANKLKTLSDKGDKKLSDVKASAKETLETGKQVVKGIAKDTVGKAWDDAKEVAKSHKEIAQAAGKKIGELKDEVKDKLVKVSGQSQAAFKSLFSKVKDMSPEQKKTFDDLSAIFEKLQAGKTASGSEAIKILAAVLAKSPEPGQLPKYSSYTSALEKLRTTSGISSYKISIKKN